MQSVFTLASSYFALEAPLDRPTAFLVLSLSNDHNLLRKKLFCIMSVFDHSEKFIIIIIKTDCTCKHHPTVLDSIPDYCLQS